MGAAGPRGAAWVWLQFAVMAATAAAGLLPPHWPRGAHSALSGVGAALALGGAAIAVWSSRLHGSGFTPFPRPREGGRLVEAGPYRVIRHPIYAGGLAFFLGYSIFASVPALALTAALAIVWALKARVEERLLRERYPGYERYARRVRFRFVPGLY